VIIFGILTEREKLIKSKTGFGFLLLVVALLFFLFIFFGFVGSFFLYRAPAIQLDRRATFGLKIQFPSKAKNTETVPQTRRF